MTGGQCLRSAPDLLQYTQHTKPTVKHFKFQLTNGVETIPVDVMKDTLGNAITLVQNIYGDRYEIKSVESPLFCAPCERRQPAPVVEDSRFTSRPGCGISQAWDNN